MTVFDNEKLENGKIQIDKDYILLVEGYDEFELCNKLYKFLGKRNVQLINLKGKDKLENVVQEIKDSERYLSKNLKSIGIVLDAEQEDVKASYKKIIKKINKILESDFSDQKQMHQEYNSLSLGIFIMPDNENKGMLEDLFLKIISNKEVYHCIDKFASCVTGTQKIERESKHKVLAYLSTLSKGDVRSIGNAVKHDLIDLENIELKPLKDFLTEMAS